MSRGGGKEDARQKERERTDVNKKKKETKTKKILTKGKQESGKWEKKETCRNTSVKKK